MDAGTKSENFGRVVCRSPHSKLEVTNFKCVVKSAAGAVSPAPECIVHVIGEAVTAPGSLGLLDSILVAELHPLEDRGF